jgi:formylglycine-generating enzyme required for sulfatase activity
MPMLTRTELGQSLDQARRVTDSLFQLVRADAIYDRPVPERHRLVFYLGHLEAFDWNLIARYALDIPAFHPEFDRLFAFGIDPPPGQLPDDTPAAWPGIASIQRYNQRTREIIDEQMENVPEQLLHVAIEHRLMHAETFAYLMHQLPYAKKHSVATELPPAAALAGEEFVEIPAGEAQLGLDREAAFGWDNEFQSQRVSVPEFSIARHKVTNRQYLDFVRQGGDPPFFWNERGGRWTFRGMFAEYPLPLDHPVYCTLEQARAFAAWRGMRLPTEPEYHRAAEGASPSVNSDFRYWDTVPVTADDAAAGSGPAQMIGNGWEWTSTVFAPFPGFEPFPFYSNYSEPFFDGQHFVLKGGSPRTASCFLRPSFRNWFRPQYPYIYATFRMVRP